MLTDIASKLGFHVSGSGGLSVMIWWQLDRPRWGSRCGDVDRGETN
jgi:hypothetical protein